MKKKDFAACKRWLRRSFPVEAPVRVLCVSEKTLRKHQESCKEHEKEWKIEGLCSYYTSAHNGITPIKFTIYIPKDESERNKLLILKHEYAHAMRESMPDFLECDSHDGVWKSIFNRIKKMWAEA